jgi:hypothetical protein
MSIRRLLFVGLALLVSAAPAMAQSRQQAIIATTVKECVDQVHTLPWNASFDAYYANGNIYWWGSPQSIWQFQKCMRQKGVSWDPHSVF